MTAILNTKLENIVKTPAIPEISPPKKHKFITYSNFMELNNIYEYTKLCGNYYTKKQTNFFFSIWTTYILNQLFDKIIYLHFVLIKKKLWILSLLHHFSW